MAITSVSGIAGEVQAPQNPFAGFAEQMIRAKAMQRDEARQGLEFMAKMTQESGGRFLPDPKEVEKLAKRAGMPNMLTASGESIFTGMAASAKQREQAATERGTAELEQLRAQTKELGARTTQAESADALNQLNIAMAKNEQRLQTMIGDPQASQQDRTKAATQLAFLKNPTGENAALLELSQKDPEAFARHTDAVLAQKEGRMTDEQRRIEATKNAPAFAQYFGGDEGKAEKYLEARYAGKDTDLKPGKSELYDAQMRAYDVQISSELTRANAALRQANAAELNVAGENLERQARALKELMQAAGGGKGVDTESATKMSEVLSRLVAVMGKKGAKAEDIQPLIDETRKILMNNLRGSDVSTTQGESAAPGSPWYDPSGWNLRGFAQQALPQAGTSAAGQSLIGRNPAELGQTLKQALPSPADIKNTFVDFMQEVTGALSKQAP